MLLWYDLAVKIIGENFIVKKKKENKLEKTTDTETRTIEELLIDLRNEKSWTYINVMQELSKMGVFVDEKTIKKWEIGLEYPDTNTMYKLSELYFISFNSLIVAKNNSYAEGYKSIHNTLIKWFCYITGFSIKAGYLITYISLYVALIGAFMFFISRCNELLRVQGRI